MENNVEKHDVPDISNRPRSLDLRNFYEEKSRVAVRRARTGNGQLSVSGESMVSKRRGFPTESRRISSEQSRRNVNGASYVSSSTLEPAGKRRREDSSISRLKADGLFPGTGKLPTLNGPGVASSILSKLTDTSHDLGDGFALSPGNKKDKSSLNAGDSQNLSGLHGDIVIPKRPRGFSRQKKSGSSVSSKKATGLSSCSIEGSAYEQNRKLSSESVTLTEVSGGTRKKRYDEFKAHGRGKCNSFPRSKDEDGSSGRMTQKNVRRNCRTRQDVSTERLKHVESDPLLFEDVGKVCDDFHEDDEENLEQNAARMLSSRFDSRFTGFSAIRIAYSPKSPNKSSLLVNSKGLGPGTSSVDIRGRVLRPRKQNGRSFVRKRRHFYEVCSRNIDPYWLLKRKIRVFWPLDQTWYFGYVKDYNPVTKLHHVKYDDHDEEWINLQNERFKLLLFSSEFTSDFDSEDSGLKSKQKNEEGHENAMKAICISNIMESEPIISWLARSAHRMKLSSISKRKSHHLKKVYVSSFSAEKESMTACLSSLNSEILPSSYIMLDKSIDKKIADIAMINRRTGCGDKKLNFVYFRRRFRKRAEGPDNKLEGVSPWKGSTNSVRLLASIAGGVEAYEKFNTNFTAMNLREGALKFRLPLHWVLRRVFVFEGYWLCNTLLLLRYGSLMLVWPKVQMEIAFFDNIMGLMFVSFEGCLLDAVSLLCMIIRIVHRLHKYTKRAELRLPCTWIRFKLSCLHNEGRQLLFTLYNFLELESSRWVQLHHSLKQQHVAMKELSLSECTYGNIKNFLCGSDQIFCDSVCKEMIMPEGLQKISWKGIIHQLEANKSAINDTGVPSFRLNRHHERLSPFSRSLAPTPTSFLLLHFKLLVEKSAPSISFQKPDATSSFDCPVICEKFTDEGCSPIGDSSDQVSEIKHENLVSSVSQVAGGSVWLSHYPPNVKIDALSISNDGSDQIRSYCTSLKSEPNLNGKSVGHKDLGKNGCDETVSKRYPFQSKTWQGDGHPCSPSLEDISSPDKSEGQYHACLNTVNVQSQTSRVENSVDVQLRTSQVEGCSSDSGMQIPQQSASDLAWKMNDCTIHSPTPTARRSIWQRKKNVFVSPSFGHHRTRLCSEDFVWDGFVNSYKKPRTQISYSLPFGGYDFGSKPRSHHRKGRSYKKSKTNSANGSPQRYPDLLTCDTNILVTVGDRGWREYGAQVVLDFDDQKCWRILVKLSGATRYSHKAHQFLQPGLPNRYTHSMMWRGGKDWTLEFTDRSQWSLFKELFEECYNRNIRAASVKKIPIPGVRLIDDGDDYVVEVPFVHSSKYFRQIGTEVDMAMDSSHVFYDMDSDDEEWTSKLRNSVDNDGNKLPGISEEMFEKAMDVFEKVAFTQQCDEFTDSEIDNLMVEVGPLDAIKAIHEHWQQKRQKKGLPLIRQFQPALWERYQQQVKEWELAMSKMHSSSNGCQEKVVSIKKLPMFAFCLRPRGLEVPNKGSKQRSYKKLAVSGLHGPFAREHGGCHAFGRKMNGYPIGEEKALGTVANCESSDASLWLHSPTSFSPRDATSSAYTTTAYSGSGRNQHLQLHRNNSKKMGMPFSPRDYQMMPMSYSHRAKGSVIFRWDTGLPEWSCVKQYRSEDFQRHQADIDEFRLRDASSAAQHASNMAKLKREKAQWLLHKADLALHKAVVALMNADAIKVSEKDLIGDG